MKFKNLMKLEMERAEHKRYCKHCGHSIVFTPSAKHTRTICSWCGHWIYKNDKEEFKANIKKILK